MLELDLPSKENWEDCESERDSDDFEWLRLNGILKGLSEGVRGRK